MGIIRKDKIIVVLGPTASGKSELAVELAKEFNGEVVSADSRQVYIGMDIGSGKITKKEMSCIPHHMLSIASPKRNFSAGQYQKKAEKTINKIIKNNKLPIICGGSNFYVNTITKGLVIPDTKPNYKLRNELNKLDVKKLYQILKKIDPPRAKNIDQNNPRRLIRAIEVAPSAPLKENPKYDCLKLAIKKDNLDILIKKRLDKRIKLGMIKEVKRLKNSGLSWSRIESFGLEYKWIAIYLQNKISKEEMLNNIFKSSIKLAKNQNSWLNKEKDIYWIRNKKEAKKLIKEFLN
ncbi:MAG: tRNA dimethylallyltransferase [Parcubacteria group bacterium ADurb.Bin247]|jgi:tRNA dimethylallyltransferase|nr:MAG: tRNA dimethylallyltransferase [Parcubacteria group bacterium ADurb.Bin247]